MIQRLFDIDLTKRNWKQVIIWWETRRLLYNLILLVALYTSMLIIYVNIPLIYLVIVFFLNLIYTFGWICELVIIQKTFPVSTQKSYPKRIFLVYLLFSIFVIFGFQFMLLV
ncbi:hypothetical protein DMA11_19025 [Marinilabiliaceae bacterium JC017]|nr:hypothetical protein DMA11_19025 [Marinilabiliaceae bacterium JC017]